MRVIKLLFIITILSIFLWMTFCILTLPSLSGLGNKTRAPSISVLDTKNRIIGSLGDVYGGIMLQEDIPTYLSNAVIVLEDKRFYSHHGIDVRGMIRALYRNIIEFRYAQGASTITQQLSKLIFLNSEKNLSRKFRELVISFYLEHKYNKNQILQMYLNRVYLGSGLYGIKAATKRYFNKDTKNLTLAESALLAAILKAPSRLSPLKNINASSDRAKLVLSLLLREGYISQKEQKIAMIELEKMKKKNFLNSASARYFIDWIYTMTPDEVLKNKKDLHIVSTLDFNLQNKAYELVKKVTKKRNDNIQTALVIMDFKGAVKTIIGGNSWIDSKYNRATQSRRQVGSIFKTYLYLTALDIGYKLNDKIEDLPFYDREWMPKNYANKYEGNINLKRAFAISSNVAAVRLSEKIGREPTIKYTRKLGIISDIPNEPSMPLGVAAMSLLEVVGSFGAICGNGKAVIPYGINEILLRDGETVWKRDIPTRKKIISSSTLKKIKILLREVVKNGTGRKLSSLSFEVIGKTGTSQKNRDAWFIGCTKGHVIGVWVGRDDDKSMKNIFGSGLPLDIFRDISEQL